MSLSISKKRKNQLTGYEDSREDTQPKLKYRMKPRSSQKDIPTIPTIRTRWKKLTLAPYLTPSVEKEQEDELKGHLHNNIIVPKPFLPEITEITILRGILEFVPSASMISDNVPQDLMNARRLWQSIRDTPCIDGWLHIKMLKYETPRKLYALHYKNSSLESSLHALRLAITDYQTNTTPEIKSANHQSFYVLGGQTPGPYGSKLGIFKNDDEKVLQNLARQQHPSLTILWKKLRELELNRGTYAQAREYEKAIIRTFKELKTLCVQEHKPQSYNRRWNVRTDFYCINLEYTFPEDLSWNDDFGPLIKNPFDSGIGPAKAARILNYNGPHLLFGCAICLAQGAMPLLKRRFGGNNAEALLFLQTASFPKDVAPDVAIYQALKATCTT